jgi:hypothetical protein
MTEKASAQDVIDTLKSIDASLKLLVAHFGCVPQTAPAATGRTIPRVASDSDLDGKYGDPVVRAKSPRDWSGEDQLGKPFSQCPPAYLELVADRLDYFNTLEPDAKKQTYQALDASRARGWAARMRAGWTPPVDTAGFPSDAPVVDDADVAF